MSIRLDSCEPTVNLFIVLSLARAVKEDVIDRWFRRQRSLHFVAPNTFNFKDQELHASTSTASFGSSLRACSAASVLLPKKTRRS